MGTGLERWANPLAQIGIPVGDLHQEQLKIVAERVGISLPF